MIAAKAFQVAGVDDMDINIVYENGVVMCVHIHIKYMKMASKSKKIRNYLQYTEPGQADQAGEPEIKESATKTPRHKGYKNNFFFVPWCLRGNRRYFAK